MIYNRPEFLTPDFGCTEDKFEHSGTRKIKDSIHGVGHVNRVIFWTLVLSKAHGRDDTQSHSSAVAAAIHDLSRKHDGVCNVHGEDAVKYANRDNYILSTYGDAVGKRYIVDAVKYHCIDDSATPFHVSSWTTWSTLKDADALDRCRFGDVVNARMLRETRSHLFIRAAEELFKATGHNATIDEVWEAGVKILNPHLGFAEKVKDGWDASEDPAARMVRRVCSSPANVSALQHGLSMMRLKGVRAMPDAIAEVGFTPSEIIDYAVPAIAVPHDVIERIKCGEPFKTVWETGPTWHSLYNERPLDARAYHEHRLFGEKLNNCPTAFLYNAKNRESKWCGIKTARRISEMYGSRIFTLKKDLLKCSSFTFGDSHQASSAAFYSAISLACQYMVNKATGDIADGDPPTYIELQIHKMIGWDDVERELIIPS